MVPLQSYASPGCKLHKPLRIWRGWLVGWPVGGVWNAVRQEEERLSLQHSFQRLSILFQRQRQQLTTMTTKTTTKRCQEKDNDKKMSGKRQRQKDVRKKTTTKRCQEKDNDNNEEVGGVWNAVGREESSLSFQLVNNWFHSF